MDISHTHIFPTGRVNASTSYVYVYQLKNWILVRSEQLFIQ